MSFRLAPKLVTLNYLRWRNGPYFALFLRIWIACGADYVKIVEDKPILSPTKM